MPFTYELRPQEKVAFVIADGAIDLRSAIETMGRVAQDPRFDSDFSVLVDAASMDYHPTLGELRVLAWALGAERSIFRNKIALVRPRGYNQHEYVRRLARLTGADLSVFADRDTALAWIHGM